VLVPGLRILLRLAPFFVGALAAAVWLRRRSAQRTPLPATPLAAELEPSTAPAGPGAAAAGPAVDPPEPGVDPPAPAAEPPEAAVDPLRPGDPEPISIVTVVDDLLEIGR
jgi:hypothetical protein